jgi:hypothetical protein
LFPRAIVEVAGREGIRYADAVFLLSLGPMGPLTAEGGRERACPPRRLRRAQKAVREPSRGAGHRVSQSVGHKPSTGIIRAPGPGYERFPLGTVNAA